MTRVVYIDVLFAVNLIVNYFILLAVSVIFHRSDKRWRLLAGACFGALYCLMIFIPALNYLYSAGLKLLLSVVIVCIAYRFSSVKSLLRLIAGFYVTSFIFGGVVFAVYLFASPPGLYMNNGVFYIDISPLLLIASSAGCYVLVALVSRFLHRNDQSSSVYDLQIYLGSRTVNIKALMDTGNILCDQITGMPVIVAEYQSIEKLIPQSLRPAFKACRLDELAQAAQSGWSGRLRMIPYHSVGEAGGLLPAFKPDKICAVSEKKRIDTSNVLIAVSGKKLSRDRGYTALLNSHMLRELTAE